MREHDQSSIFSTGRKFRPGYVWTSIGVTRSYSSPRSYALLPCTNTTWKEEKYRFQGGPASSMMTRFLKLEVMLVQGLKK